MIRCFLRLNLNSRVECAAIMSREQLKQRLITCFGWAFDAFTVAISITDVISDVLVAVQFYHAGHVVWSYLVFGAFANSSLVYSVILAVMMFDKHSSEFHVGSRHFLPRWALKIPLLIRVLILLPFSQLAPSGMYVLQMFYLPWRRKQQNVYEYENPADCVHEQFASYGAINGVDGIAGGQVDAEEVQAVEDTFTLVARLQLAIKNQVFTHGMLFAETIVESIPQSIIQLLAITFLGEPSVLQVVSMALSILSVVTKAYFVSLSYNVRVFVFKFCVLSFDVMTMFYIFATVLSQDRAQQVDLFGSSIRVSYLTYAWFIKLTAMFAFTIVVCAVIGLFALIADWIIQKRSCHVPRWSDVKVFLALTAITILSLIPIALVQESAKLSWIVFFLVRWEPRHELYADSSIISSFLMRSANDEEMYERVVHLMRSFAKCDSCGNDTHIRFHVGTSVLFQFMDELAQIEASFLETFGSADNLSDVDDRSSRRSDRNSLRRAPSQLSNAFDPVHHPLGYFAIKPWSAQRKDAHCDKVLSDWVAEKLPLLLKLKGRPNDPNSQADSDSITHLAFALRDREIHNLLGKYRDHMAMLSDPTALFDFDGLSPAEYVERWKFDHVFSRERMKHYWNTFHDPVPPLECFVRSYIDPTKKEANPFAIAFWIWFPVNIVANCAFSVGFVFYSFVTDYETQNLLQKFCFYSSAAFLCVALLQGRVLIRYVSTMKIVATLMLMLPMSPDYYVDMHKSITSFYQVPAAAVLSDALPTNDLLSPQAVNIVAAYLGNDVDCSEMSTADCLSLRRRNRFHT